MKITNRDWIIIVKNIQISIKVLCLLCSVVAYPVPVGSGLFKSSGSGSGIYTVLSKILF